MSLEGYIFLHGSAYLMLRIPWLPPQAVPQDPTEARESRDTIDLSFGQGDQ